MSYSLPLEILDLIIDHLRDEPAALKTCCVVSKSWIPRTRRHLFAHVEFDAQKSHIELWRETFPDPSDSPAHHTRSLFIRGLPTTTATDEDMGGWIRTFHRVVRLRVDTFGRRGDGQVSLIPLYGLSPTLRSLRLTYRASTSPSEVFGLACSFPLLEDLALFSLGHDDEGDGWNIPLTSPRLTGSLDLRMLWGIRSAVRRLLDLPDGLHFTKITVSCLNEDVESTMNLVSKCSDTLESLSICYCVSEMPRTPSIDLSKATKLRDVEFGCSGPNIHWITMVLQTVESKGLRQITIHSHTVFANPIEETVHKEWQDLDRLLLQFWTSRSIRPRIMYEKGKGGTDLRDFAPSLLPELTKGGAVDLVEFN